MGESCTDPFPKSHALERLTGFNFEFPVRGGHIGKRWPTIHSRNETEQSARRSCPFF